MAKMGMKNITHGLSKTRLHNVWRDIKRRCCCPSRTDYKHYGYRGIQVCDEWKNDFKAFYDWAMSNGYKEDLTIDRINNNGDYSPKNCRWVDMKTQNRNKRTTKIFTLNGETKCAIEWALSFNIKPSVLYSRLSRGWDIEKALHTPVNH